MVSHNRDLADVLVIGAGPAGCAAAHHLAGRGLSVRLLDKASFPRDKTCGDGLTPRALQALAGMGVLAEVQRAGRRVDRLELAAPHGPWLDAPFPALAGRFGYALTIPRLLLDNLLLERAAASGAQFESRVHVTGVSSGPDRVTITGERQGQPVTYHGRAGIVAVGASTALLTRSGILDRTPAVALAARAYFEGISGPASSLALRFDGVPLPGYGWIFPMVGSAANVGAGIFPRFFGLRRASGTAQAAFNAFVRAPALRPVLAGARQVGPLKGHPLRIDFPGAPVFGERFLLAGEAAGLVNPLTGEGIDYALESGRMAAEYLVAQFAAGDLSRQGLAGYELLLRRRFQGLFSFCRWWRNLTVNRWLVDPLIGVAARAPAFKMLMVNIVFG
jgi:geranylgeranyl reductase family protein